MQGTYSLEITPDRVVIRGDAPKVELDFDDVFGLDDNIIPFGESLALEEAVPADRAQVYLLRGLQHVDRDFDSLDAWRMWRALQALLAQRD